MESNNTSSLSVAKESTLRVYSFILIIGGMLFIWLAVGNFHREENKASVKTFGKEYISQILNWQKGNKGALWLAVKFQDQKGIWIERNVRSFSNEWRDCFQEERAVFICTDGVVLHHPAADPDTYFTRDLVKRDFLHSTETWRFTGPLGFLMIFAGVVCFIIERRRPSKTASTSSSEQA